MSQEAPTHERPRDMSIECTRAGYGYFTFVVDSYREFLREIAPRFVNAKARDHRGEWARQEFVWRGMADPRWQLQSSLTRFASREVKVPWPEWERAVFLLTVNHLIEYLQNLRGTSLLNREHDSLFQFLLEFRNSPRNSFVTVLNRMTPSQLNLTHELFALGQHYDLLTPFLDWSAVPQVALWFAFHEQESRREGVGYRTVYALNRTAVERICPPEEAKGPEDIQILGSMAHNNDRIVSQSGLFTFVPAHLPVDQWVVVRSQQKRVQYDTPVLIRFLIRNVGRCDCLAELAAMNVHSRTVYPDRFGAARHANYLTAVRS